MPDTVLAVVSRTNLSAMLTAYHRAGYGSVIRVLDPERAPIGDQLQRAGVQARSASRCPGDAVVVFVHAPKRTTDATAIAVATGATEVELSERSTGINDGPPSGIIQTAQNRRLRRLEPGRATIPSCTETPIAAD